MKTLIFVGESDDKNSSVWQFDRAMALIAYDYQVSVVFHDEGLSEMHNKAWKNLTLFGIEDVFYIHNNQFNDQNLSIPAKKISAGRAASLVQAADLVL